MKDESNLALANINGTLVEVDKDICSLIETLNNNGHTTYFSCSSHPKLKKHSGYIMLEYKKDTFDMFMSILDNIGDKSNFNLQLEIEINKQTELHKKHTDIQIDKALLFRFRSTNTDNYKLVLEMFKFIEEFVIKYSLPRVIVVNDRFVYIANLKDVKIGDIVDFDSDKKGTVMNITDGLPTLLYIINQDKK